MAEEINTCPVCGYPGLADPPYGDAGEPSYEICPSCGTEFGLDDDVTSHEELRRRWLEGGARWWSSSIAPPPGWDPQAQLSDAELTG